MGVKRFYVPNGEGGYPTPEDEYIYSPPPGITLAKLHKRWMKVDPAYSWPALKKASKELKWPRQRQEHWSLVVRREAEIRAAIDVEVVSRSRSVNALTLTDVQEGLQTAARMALQRLRGRSREQAYNPKADRADCEILVKAAVGSELVAKVWAGFHGVQPGFEQEDILVEFVTPDWAIPDDFPEVPQLPPSTKVIDVDLVPPGSNGKNGSNGR